MILQPTPADDFAAQARTAEMLAQTLQNQRAILEALRESMADGTPLAVDIDNFLPQLTDERLAAIDDNAWWDSLGEAVQAEAWVGFRAAMEGQRLPYPQDARLAAEAAFVRALRQGRSAAVAGVEARDAFLTVLAASQAAYQSPSAPVPTPAAPRAVRPELTVGVEDLDVTDAELIPETPQQREAREDREWRKFHRQRFGWNA